MFKTNLGPISIDRYLAETSPVDGSEERLPIYYFTDAGAERQLYQLAEAGNRVVINANLPFDMSRLCNYAERHDAKVYLHPVDDVEAPGLFGLLSKEDFAQYLCLGNDMTKCLRRAGIDDVEVHIRRFTPASIAAVIFGMQDRRDGPQAPRSLLDPLGLLENFGLLMDAVLKQDDRTQRCLVLNADHTLIKSLSHAEARNEVGDEFMIGVYGAAHACTLISDEDDVFANFAGALEKAIRWRSALTWLDKHRADTLEAFH